MALRLPARPVLIAAGAVAATVLAGPALAATSAQHTTLTINAASTGSSTVAQDITGTLKAGTSPVAKQVVRLVGRVNGSSTFQTLHYARTTDNGVVTFSIKPPKGHDVYELVYNGSHRSNPPYAGSHSRTVTITVAK